MSQLSTKHEIGYKLFHNTRKPKLDKNTLPKDGAEVAFQDEDENWHEWTYCDVEQYFVVSSREWYSAWTILWWCNKSSVEIVKTMV